MKRKQLSSAQEAFAQWVAALDNQSEAYRRAYPGARSWTPEAVHCRASKLASDATVMQRIDELREARSAAFQAEAVRQGITPEQIVREQACSAFFDPASIFDEHGRLLPLHKMPEQARRAVKSVKIKGIKTGDDSIQGVVAEIQLNDKLKALRDLGDYLQMYKQVHEHHRQWIDGLRHMTEAELENEQARIEAELADALKDRDRSRSH